MLRAAGLPATGAAALSIAGYSGLMILELGGAVLVVLALVTGLEITGLGRDVGILSIPAGVLMTLHTLAIGPTTRFEKAGSTSSRRGPPGRGWGSLCPMTSRLALSAERNRVRCSLPCE